ncbi:hypothetical protein HRG_001052 [Hirsutella rhossiliensis]|uniref:Tse2 ADP-ribosyltransferase toxin domain-containing protein n=1 Tax=Hirsutella rhossiliensis TaxID=111463 RepID=A0A9P8N7T3_9HYPO|nr:uncharacterized protein HRG_01052 [Hirsutella rhossiliensis]KAH0968410.1 hypothetical protein HRG_01052 [Hirsutella rhossiliensis]
MSKLIKVLRTLPTNLFRVNNGPQVRLREWSRQRRVFDICPANGLVKPLALDPKSYRAPNGASMRPNSPYQQHLVSNLFRGDGVIVYSVPAGTQLPQDLLLVHERTDHYSLQPGREMTLQDLNDIITTFLRRNATVYTREQWLEAYPEPTEHV